MVGLADCRNNRIIHLFPLAVTVVKAMLHRQGCFWLLTIILAATLAGCSGSGKKWNPDDYTVKSGDTVYSIAWRYEIDTEDFAAWNNLSESQLIKPGQRLHTRKPWNFDASRKSVSTEETSYERNLAYAPESSAASHSAAQNYPDQPWVKASKGDSLYAISRRYGVSVERLAQLNQLKKPYLIHPGQTVFLKPLNDKVKKAPATGGRPKAAGAVVSKHKKTKPTAWPSTIKWARPANGKVIKKYNRSRNDAKGIDIAGKLGQEVRAAADGKVVYSGDGLISYGNLIIIKHNKSFLSAYAYNHKLLVKEGDTVKSGQKIAEMGRKDQLSPILHFEIRKNGKPVDPLKYLPWK